MTGRPVAWASLHFGELRSRRSAPQLVQRWRWITQLRSLGSPWTGGCPRARLGLDLPDARTRPRGLGRYLHRLPLPLVRSAFDVRLIGDLALALSTRVVARGGTARIGRGRALAGLRRRRRRQCRVRRPADDVAARSASSCSRVRTRRSRHAGAGADGGNRGSRSTSTPHGAARARHLARVADARRATGARSFQILFGPTNRRRARRSSPSSRGEVTVALPPLRRDRLGAGWAGAAPPRRGSRGARCGSSVQAQAAAGTRRRERARDGERGSSACSPPLATPRRVPHVRRGSRVPSPASRPLCSAHLERAASASCPGDGGLGRFPWPRTSYRSRRSLGDARKTLARRSSTPSRTRTPPSLPSTMRASSSSCGRPCSVG